MNTEDAIGKWFSILTNLGIAVSDSPNRHTACPICGGKDRFRFDDKEGKGTWICNQCGAGDGWMLVQQFFNIDFKGAFKGVEVVIGSATTSATPRPTSMPVEDIRAMLNKLFKASSPIIQGGVAWSYLEARKIRPSNVTDLRYCPKCYCSELKKEVPAMLGVVRNRKWNAVAIHRTYLDGYAKAKLNSPKMLTPTKEKLESCFIELSPAAHILGVAEGIETALAAENLFNIPTWALISTKIMESFVPPEGVVKLIIFGDNDANYQGQSSAYKLASKLSSKISVEVKIPEFHKDWNDVLINKLGGINET